MGVQIRKVETKAQLKAFIKFPARLYAGVPQWVPSPPFDDMNTLSKDKNPAFDFCEAEYWTAWRDGVMVGRVAGIINNRYIEKWGKKYARFGWIDFVEDFEVASALVSTVEAWALSRGMIGLHGPLGFTDLDREGLLVEGYQERGTFATIYNYPYYCEFLERLGYAKDTDWIEFLIEVPDAIPEKVQRVQDLIAKRTGISVCEWKKPRELVSRFGDQIFSMLDETYSHLYGTTPLSKRQVENYIKQYLGFADPRFIKVLVDAEGKLAGFGLSIPNLSDALNKCKGELFPLGWFYLLRAMRKPEVVDMLLVAVRPEYQARGVIALLMTAFNKSANAAGVRFAESNPELETNIQVHGLWKDFRKRQHKRRRVYLKTLSSASGERK
jgi:GNAT superfamily N-acetyltransferase